MPMHAGRTEVEGRIRLESEHDAGGVQCLVAQVEHGRGGSAESGLLVRGMAKANADAQGDFAALLTGGRLGLLIEPERGGQNYQAVVAVEGQHLADALEFYFSQSEQLPTLLRLDRRSTRLNSSH